MHYPVCATHSAGQDTRVAVLSIQRDAYTCYTPRMSHIVAIKHTSPLFPRRSSQGQEGLCCTCAPTVESKHAVVTGDIRLGSWGHVPSVAWCHTD